MKTIKRYDNKKYLKEENSLSMLKDTKTIDKIIEFIKENPFPVDEQLHKFAGENNIEPDTMESHVYAILSVFLTGGKSKGKEADADKENKDIGFKIETEHVDTGIDNKVVKHIEDILKTKIANDHLFETKTYYTDGVNFLNELKQEGK